MSQELVNKLWDYSDYVVGERYKIFSERNNEIGKTTITDPMKEYLRQINSYVNSPVKQESDIMHFNRIKFMHDRIQKAIEMQNNDEINEKILYENDKTRDKPKHIMDKLISDLRTRVQQNSTLDEMYIQYLNAFSEENFTNRKEYNFVPSLAYLSHRNINKASLVNQLNQLPIDARLRINTAIKDATIGFKSKSPSPKSRSRSRSRSRSNSKGSKRSKGNIGGSNNYSRKNKNSK